MAQPDTSQPARGKRPTLASMILLGLAAGIGCGLFFGDYCSPLSVVGEAFVGLLRMTVMPYIMVSLVANFGRLAFEHSRRLAMSGGLILLGLWVIGLVSVVALPWSFPEWKTGSFFSSAIVEPPPPVNFLEIFIPANVFASLYENHVPAVVLLCICVGLALSGLEHRQALISQLDVLAKALLRVSGFVTRLAPLGVFAIAASTAGTISLEEVTRLQAYLLAYTGGAIVLGLVVLPLLITTLTPFRYRDVMVVSRDALVTALATGKLIVVLPLLIEHTERLFQRPELAANSRSAPAVDVLYPLAYPFPHVGKLLAMTFIPFAAWFLGSTMDWAEYPSFLVAGLFSYFGGPILATPFLLEQARLPHDMFQLFLLSGVYCERLGDALGVMHLVTFTILTTCAFTGQLRWNWSLMSRWLLLSLIVGGSTILAMRFTLTNTLKYVETKKAVIGRMQLLEQPVVSVVVVNPMRNPDPLLPGETRLQRIRRRDIIRVGFNEDRLPFSYFNVYGNLVGYDVAMAHALARDLGVEIEFIPFQLATLSQQLRDDHFDVVMSGLVGTLERAESMLHTNPYMEVTLALVVPDFRAREFQSLESIRRVSGLRIGEVDMSFHQIQQWQERLPNAEFIELPSNLQFFEDGTDQLDALLISAESGSAFTLLYPDFEVVVPSGPRVSVPLFYAIGGRDTELKAFLDHWITLRREDGTMQQEYDHWILGKRHPQDRRRWCIIRDVLGWVR